MKVLFYVSGGEKCLVTNPSQAHLMELNNSGIEDFISLDTETNEEDKLGIADLFQDPCDISAEC